MKLTLINGPLAEPIGLDDVKAHLRIDGEDEDMLLASLITTSRLHVEALLGLALITQTWQWRADCWPRGETVELMTRPLQSVEAVRVRDADGGATTIDAVDYIADVGGQTGRIAPRGGRWPRPGAAIGGIEVDFTAGYGDDGSDVPGDLRHALKLLTAHWYEVRNPVHIGTTAARVPDMVSELLMPYRMRRL
ncbi:MAG: head-tail connector protein [Alphaproteobacteria bacterium]|nr:head-tail connector protein [Alphaproteobacteria bacterium]